MALGTTFLTALILSLATALPLPALAAKKTACTMTLNSSDEAEVFKRRLSTREWDFVELAQSQDSDASNWFRRACQKKVSCDILIVSGHFGGSFFGESNLELSLEELENASCPTKCDGIINKPKEVFLFGCNTLASKAPDSRTPVEYQRALVQDGFTPSQASQIVAFRYSALGGSFRSRMEQVFAQTPRIYGFTSRAPLGPQTAPTLDRYLKSTNLYKGDFDQKSDELGVLPNRELLQALGKTTITQAAGVRSTGKSEKPYCRLQGETSTRAEKLQFVESALAGGHAFNFITHITRFVQSLRDREDTFSDDERKTLEALRMNAKVRSDFERYLKLPGEIYLPVRVSILNLMMELEIIGSDEYARRLQNEIAVNFQSPLERSQVDRLCSLGVRANLVLVSIPEARWNEDALFELLSCLRPRNQDVLLRLVSAMIPRRSPPGRTQTSEFHFPAREALGRSDVSISRVHQAVLKAAQDQSLSVETRRQALDLLGDMTQVSVEIQRELAKIAQNDADYFIRHSAAASLSNLKPTDTEVLKRVHESLLREHEFGVREYLSLILRGSDTNDPAILRDRELWK